MDMAKLAQDTEYQELTLQTLYAQEALRSR
jgi:hypothetical protein